MRDDPPFWPRLTIGGVMALVAVAALVLFFVERIGRVERAKIARARAVLKSLIPGVDAARYEGKLGPMSADGRYQMVELHDEERGNAVEVALPNRGGRPTPGLLPIIRPLPPPGPVPAPGTPPPAAAARPGNSPTGTP